jgi:hypothetical protein
MRKKIILFTVLSAVVLVLLKVGIVWVKPTAILLQPRSFPYALAVASENAVTFKVHLVNQTTAADPEYVSLQQANNPDLYKLNDLGKDGDKFAGDNIYGGTINLRAPEQPGECLQYSASAAVGKTAIKSPVYTLCATSLPIGFVESNTRPENLIFTEKETSLAIADELLVRFNGEAGDQQIVAAAKAVDAQVVGSVLPRNMYQFKFARSLSVEQLSAYIKTLLESAGVEDAYVNQVGSFASLPEDPEYLSGGQHGYTLINADDAWELGADGTGVTIAVLDSGVAGHGDLPIAGSDAINHGTAMAGIAGALTNNTTGVAAPAGSSTLESYVVSADAGVTMAEMVAGFQAVASSSTAQVVIAGFNTTLAPPGSNLAGVADQWDLCAAINDVVLNGSTPVAVVISAAGNNNSNSNHYPSKCNDNSAAANARLTNKSLLITVMGSVSCSSGCTPDTRQSNSNYGAWIDVVAPAQNIRGTNNAGGYGNFSGTSFAAALVGGTAAQMLSCGATVSQIQSRMISTAPVMVSYPGGGSEARIDSHAAVLAGNTAPTGIGLVGFSSINEDTDTSLGFTLGSLAATDANNCDRHTYNIQGGADAGSFSIGGPGMDQLILTAGMLDFETKSSYSVTVRTTDAGGLIFDQPFTIAVNDLVENTTPVVDEQSFSIDENSANETVVGTVTANDAENDSLSFSITEGNTGDAFAIGAGTGAITVNNSAALDFETTPSFALTVEVSDGGPTDKATVTVNLNNLDDTPIP